MHSLWGFSLESLEGDLDLGPGMPGCQTAMAESCDRQQWQRVVIGTQMCGVILHCVQVTRPNIKGDVSLLFHIQKHGGNLGEQWV